MASVRSASSLCRELLDAELQFYNELEQLLTAMVTVNLFSADAATTLSVQMDDLQCERDRLNHRRDECQQSLSRLLPRGSTPLRMAELEPMLPVEERAALRQRRLLVVRRLEGIQRQLWRTDVLLASRHSLFGELIGTLTGQSLTTNCYGANGRREHHVAGSVIEAVS